MRPKYRTAPKNVDASAHPRRRRTEPDPTNKHYVLTERKLRVLQALRFGPIPSGLLVRPFYDGAIGHADTVKRQLTDLFHESYEGHTLVYRPDELNPDGNPMQPAVYDLTDKGIEAAEVTISVPRRDHDRHRCMGACINLSFEQLAPEHGLIFHDQEYSFAHKDCPEATVNSSNPLLVPLREGQYEPDALLSFESKSTGLFRFFVREDCRGNVGFSRADKKQNSNKDKVDKQLEVLERRLHVTQWGIPSLSVMWVMTTQAHVDRILRYLKDKKHAYKFYFKVLPQFSTKQWKYPKEPIEALFEPWQTVNGTRDITQP